MDSYYEQAVACVKDSVLPEQRRIYKEYGGNLDAMYGENTDDGVYTGRVIESGHVYEFGYHTCTCQKVLSGAITDPAQCECSRQSILYILNQLEPDSEFDVEIMETVLPGSNHCKFKIIKK